MKHRIGLLISLFIFSQICTSANAQKVKITVLDLTASGGLSQQDVSILTDKLINELVNVNTFDVVDRSNRDKALKEVAFQQSGASDAILVQAGQLMGVQKMIDGKIGKLGNIYTVNLRMLDVTTGKIDKAFTKQYGDSEEEGVVVGKISDLLYIMKDAAIEFSKFKSKSKIKITSIQSVVETGGVLIQTKPRGAVIIIGGDELSETPAQLDGMDVGECRIKLKKNGYQTFDTTVNIKANITDSINIALVKTIPKLMVLVNEINGDRYSNDFIGVTGNIIITTLRNKGFVFIDNESALKTIRRDKATAAFDGDAEASAWIGNKAGAKIIIICNATAQNATVANDMLGGMKSMQSTVTATVYDADDGSVLATKVETGRAVNIDTITGGEKAIEQAATKVADYLSGVIGK